MQLGYILQLLLQLVYNFLLINIYPLVHTAKVDPHSFGQMQSPRGSGLQHRLTGGQQGPNPASDYPFKTAGSVLRRLRKTKI